MYIVHFKCSFSFVLRSNIIWGNFLDNDKADEKQCVEQQTGHEEAIDYDQHHLLVNAEPNNEQPHDESTSFIMVDSTSASSNVILTHTSTVEDDVTKKFSDRLAGIYKNLE